MNLHRTTLLSLALGAGVLLGQPNVPLRRVAVPQPVGADASNPDPAALPALGEDHFWVRPPGPANKRAVR